MNDSDSSRRTDIDALRVFATFLLFPFHVAMVFNPAPFYHVRNDDLSTVAMVFAGFVSLWHMPLFFVLAGWSMVASLRARGTAAFARERVTRLLVPLIVGCVLFAPAIKYIELRGGQDLNHRGLFVSPQIADSYRSVISQPLPEMVPFDERFAEFLPSFFTELDRFSWSHLWFVAYLFTLSLVWLPVLARSARRAHHERSSRGSWLFVYAPIIPLAIVQVALRPHWPGIQNLYNDWANVAYYSIFLLLGAQLAMRPAFDEALRREWLRALAVSLAALSALLAAVLGVLRSEPAVLALTAVAGWSFIVFLLGLARRRPPPPSTALAYLSEASMPIYILHQPAIVFLAWAIVAWPLAVSVKFLLILAGSLTTTMTVYRLIVQPRQISRLALGMKPVAGRVRLAKSSEIIASVVLISLATVSATHASEASPIGLWWAEGGAAKVRLEPCGDSLCARVVWLRSPFDENGCVLRDRYNPDPSLRARDVIGMQIVRDLEPNRTRDSEWNNGAIYDPTSGRTYDCVLRLRDPDRIEIRGYFGFELLGRTVTWTRVGSEERFCRE
jgi:glucan biosynthesis protein C